MKFLIFLAFLFFTYDTVLCSELPQYFGITSNSQLIKPDRTANINVKYDLGKTKENRFRIKLNAENAIVFFKDKNGWRGFNSQWTALPALSKELVVKIVTDKKSTKLNAEVQDILTGRVYKSNEVSIWSGREIETYPERLNSNVKKWARMVK